MLTQVTMNYFVNYLLNFSPITRMIHSRAVRRGEKSSVHHRAEATGPQNGQIKTTKTRPMPNSKLITSRVGNLGEIMLIACRQTTHRVAVFI